MSKNQNPSKHLCPKCGYQFTDDEQFEAMKQKAIKILAEHGLSYRGIGKLLGG